MARGFRAPAIAAMALTALLGLTGTASANDTPALVWMAINADHSSAGASAWGRLSVMNGTLTFHGSRGDWTTPLANVRRITPIKDSQHAFAIETMSGDVLRLSILDQRMLAVSPKKTIQMLQRAVREAPAARQPVLSASAAPNGAVR